MRYHSDGRRKFYGDIFANPDGDCNVVYLEPHVPIAWHRHQKQSDRLFLVQGVLRLRVFQENPDLDGEEHVLANTRGERQVYVIPPTWWHGYEALVEGTILLQFNGPGKWDGSDEERQRIEDVPWTW